MLNINTNSQIRDDSNRTTVECQDRFYVGRLKSLLTRRSSALIAKSASGPIAVTSIVDPWVAANIISPMILFPLTVSPSFLTKISD